MPRYNSKAWESIKLEELYSDVGWSKNRLHTIKLLQKFSEGDYLDAHPSLADDHVIRIFHYVLERK